MKLNFKNRIALYYIVATAIIAAIAFLTVFVIVENTVYSNLDKDLSYEVRKHTKEIQIRNDSIFFINKAEWEEREHREVQVNPVFIQLIDRQGRLMDKSPNLKDQQLPFQSAKAADHFNLRMTDRAIRQAQIPIERNGKVEGYILAAMSLEASNMVIKNLRNTLLISYPILLIGLFFISSYMAGRSIKPIQAIIGTTNIITKNNLNERVPVPHNKDELFELSAAINELLERIQSAIHRERQFTSDASHELRTPLAALRGTLEILVRKPRTQAEYEEKVKYGLSEIDRMTNMVEQLLLLARLDTNHKIEECDSVSLITQIDEIITRHQSLINSKKLKLSFNFNDSENYSVPKYYSHLILDNIINNAIKYAPDESQLTIDVSSEGGHSICSIEDNGLGIKSEDLRNLFNPFFRSDALNHKHITGVGLGLSIAKKAAVAIGAELHVESKISDGTLFTIVFLRQS
jgi:signal transduction histidine kinase